MYVKVCDSFFGHWSFQQQINSNPETYSEPCQPSKMELFALTKVNDLNSSEPLIIFEKSFISDVQHGCESASEISLFIQYNSLEKPQ